MYTYWCGPQCLLRPKRLWHCNGKPWQKVHGCWQDCSKKNWAKGPICHQNIFGNHHNEFRCTLVWDLGKHNIFQFWKHSLPWQKAFSFHVVSEVINSTLPWQKAQILFPKKNLKYFGLGKNVKKYQKMKIDEISSDFISFHFWYFLKYFWNIF